MLYHILPITMFTVTITRVDLSYNVPDFTPCKGKIGKLGLGKIGSIMVPQKYFLVFDIDHHFNLISCKR